LLDTPLAPEQREFAECIRNSADSLLGIINDILDFSKIEAGKMELDAVAFDVRVTTAEVAELMETRARAKGLRLHCRVADEVPACVRGDPGRLRQVLVNLIGNAVKFTERGEVEIIVGRADAGGSRSPGDGCVLHFAVRVTGIGIDPEAQSRLFKAFSQGDGSTSRRFGGTGLGLVISKQLVELMGGEIEIESRLAVGSKFCFTVRLTIAELAPQESTRITDRAQASAPAASSPRAPTRGRVLLVEDNRVNQQVGRAMLRALGFEVDLAEDGRIGVHAALGRDYDVVFMDCQMPEMDGLEATRTIRAREAERSRCGRAHVRARMPIVALTANALEGDRERCLAAGMDDYLSKPFRKEQLDQTLRKWIAELPSRSGTLLAANAD
jgi:CheY-like chemotaxis protein